MSAQLAQAAQAVIDRWDSPKWEWTKQGPTADLIADLRKELAAFEAAPQQEVWDAINKVQAKHLGLIKAAVDLIAQCHEQLETMPAPQCYGVPYGAVNALRAALEAAPQQAQAPGWQLVPVEPTPEMLAAVVTSLDEHLLGREAEQQYREDWVAMLAAAPQQGSKS